MADKLPEGMRTFFVIWVGQLLSLLGSGLTGFALGVWIFQRSGSATQFAMIALAATLPAILISPIAGAVVDRWDRRKVLILSDSIAALMTLILALLYWREMLSLWHILVATSVASAMGAFQGPAYQASVTLLVPKSQFGRASGMAQVARSVSYLLAPLLGGLLMVSIGIGAVMLIDFATFLFALGTLIAVRIPRPAPEDSDDKERPRLLKDALAGWVFIRERGGLLWMLLLFASLNFILGMVNALTPPMLLAFTTPERLGGILSLSGVGMLLGSLTMSVWGGPRRRIQGTLGFLLVIGLGIALVGLRPSEWLVAAGFFIVMASAPIVNGSSQAIWQSKVPPGLQGRVFAARSMIATAAMPLAYLLSGPLADRVFEPMLRAGGALSTSAGNWVGVGPGRGIGLMFVIAGVLVIFVTLIGYLNPRLRRVEEELPDTVPDEPEAAAEH
jgi:DHA3 family macrolide efflux protein-like MFS transporter